ncbi:efflux RND transporter periplasmic adaptor subunit [Veronia nyctiphanis]|nr:biotin/lipoyl-binding protein [Veronia nyctiphanis]
MRKFLTFFLILAVVGGVIFWKSKAEKPTDIYVETAEEQDIRDTILASGNLTFDTKIQLRSEVTGTVESVLVVEGDRVKKGQLLLEVNATAYQTDVDSREAQVAARNIEIERVSASQQEMLRQFKLKKSLYNKKLMGKDEYERVANQLRLANIEVKAAKVRLNQDLAALALAKDKLAKTQIRATMDG